MSISRLIEARSRFFWSFSGLALLLGVSFLDYITGSELSFSLFYLLPISLITWFVERKLGSIFAVSSALIWLSLDILSGNSYSHPVIYLWNTLIRLGFFATVMWLLALLRKRLDYERELARVDYVTDAINARHFYEILQREIDRSSRYKRPFSLIYLDLDDFKRVNDQFGHSTGDRVLSTVVAVAKSQLRKTDIVARLGGDEFAILLPETGEDAAQSVTSKLHINLSESMLRNHWPVTFSCGVLICLDAPTSSDLSVGLADNLMYIAKSHGKNTIHYSIYQVDDG